MSDNQDVESSDEYWSDSPRFNGVRWLIVAALFIAAMLSTAAMLFISHDPDRQIAKAESTEEVTHRQTNPRDEHGNSQIADEEVDLEVNLAEAVLRSVLEETEGRLQTLREKTEHLHEIENKIFRASLWGQSTTQRRDLFLAERERLQKLIDESEDFEEQQQLTRQMESIISELESYAQALQIRRQRVAKAIVRLGHDVDWEEHTVAELQDMKNRIQVANRIGHDWREHTLAELKDLEASIKTLKTLSDLGHEVDCNDYSLAELEDKLSRLWLAKTLASNHEHQVDWQEHSLTELEAMESRIKLARFIGNHYGHKIDWTEHTRAELENIRSRIIVAQNISVDWQEYSLPELQEMVLQR